MSVRSLFVRLFCKVAVYFLRFYDMELVLQHVRAEIRGKYVCRYYLNSKQDI